MTWKVQVVGRPLAGEVPALLNILYVWIPSPPAEQLAVTLDTIAPWQTFVTQTQFLGLAFFEALSLP